MNIMKYVKIIGVFGLIALSLTGCKVNAQEVEVSEGVPVDVITIEKESRVVELNYKGMVAPENQIEYAFRTGGRLGTLLVKPGDEVKEGDVLATLDKVDLSLKLNASKAQLQSAKKDVLKSEESWNYSKDILKKMEELYVSGAISKDNLEQTKLNFEIADSTLDQAREGQRIAESGLSLQSRLLDDAVLIAKADGVVLNTMYEIDEIVGAERAVLTMRSETHVVQVGLSQTDIDFVTMDTEVTLDYGNEKISGVIVELNDMPDMATRTYLAKIRTNHKSMRIGKIVDVNFNVGSKEGIWIPMNSVLSDGEKFVYVVEDGRAFKRTVTLKNVSGFELELEGIDDGALVVVGGMKKLTDGIEVLAIQEQ